MVKMGAREFVHPNFGYRSRWLQNRDPVYCQRGALLCETVPCDAVTSGFVSDLFTVGLDDKGQTMLAICLQFTFVGKGQTKHFDEKQFFQIVYKCIKCCI